MAGALRRLLDPVAQNGGGAPRKQLKEGSDYLEVRFTYSLLSNCSYNPIIPRVTVGKGFIFRL